MASVFPKRRLDDLPFVGLIIALSCGLLFPQWFTPFFTLTGVLLQFIFFASGLRIDLRSILPELKDFKLFAAVSLLRLVVFPIGVYFVSISFFPDLTVPLVLLAAMPAGMTSPLFVDMIRANVPLSLLLTAGTSLLSVVTLPVMLGLLGGDATVYEPTPMFQTLFSIMIIPILIAQLVRLPETGRLTIMRGQSLIRLSSILALWLLIASIASKHSDAILEGLLGGRTLFALFIMSALLVAFHVAAYMVCYWRSKRDRITVTLSLSYMNFTLAIFLAETLFQDPGVVLVVILSMLPWNMSLLVFQWLVRRSSWVIRG
jgi:BASS family bile acid:Na+ symporter